MVRIVVFGAGGKAGRAVVAEAAGRGHEVVAVVRDTARYADLAGSGVAVVAGDVTDRSQVAALVKGAGAVVNAVAPGPGDAPGTFFTAAANALVDAIAGAGGGRLVAIGLSACLDAAPGVRVLDTPGFPAQFQDFARAHAAALDVLWQAPATVEWSVVVPAMEFDPQGERTGTYRAGDTGLLTDADGVSRISYRDFAIAVLDEAEQGAHPRTHFAVAY
ncbi:NAD(P)-dependent oxidoreductase [Micromonospora humida]|uniref:NAD(P)H-binding protein n=1 Tax=Micromonospora humida TaxID=2809018 RepID=A0ABS2IQ30_9ACTN|nr:NAD(P)H-binding protein [Micromonospora humida]MBM7075299.1 NAD(P)H-binding protein [Micromonospora humida]